MHGAREGEVHGFVFLEGGAFVEGTLSFYYFNFQFKFQKCILMFASYDIQETCMEPEKGKYTDSSSFKEEHSLTVL